MAVARDLAGGKEHVIAVAGDAAFTNGISFEALNNIAEQTKRLIVVLNDNEWSIDRNVGAIARYFHRIVTNEHYNRLHDSARRIVEKIGGKTAVEVVRRAEEAAKSMLWPSILFEEFGLQYYGPIDGHNLPLLIETFKFLKAENRPVLLHVLTQKGRGFQPALDGQKKFHGLGPYDPETGMTKPAGVPTYAEVFANTLVKLADKDDRVVAITAAMPNGTGLDLFRPHHPKRYFDVGIAEEHAVIFAAGMATRGCARSARSTRRSCSGHSIRLCTMSRCKSCRWFFAWIAPDSPAMTAQRIMDCSTSAICAACRRWFSWLPKDEDELADMMTTALQIDGPSAIRYPRGAVAVCRTARPNRRCCPLARLKFWPTAPMLPFLDSGR